MKKLNTSVALAALAAVLSTPAVAADIEAPIVPEAADWTAFHIGVGGGGNFAFVEEDAFGFKDDDINANVAFGAHKSDLGDAGFFGTVEAGFDWQLGSSVVLGVLANYDFGKTKMDNDSFAVFVNQNDNNDIDNGVFHTEWKIGDSWAVGARAGFLAMDNALIYVMGGYTQAKIKAEADLSLANGNFTAVSQSDSSWEDGWFVGGGIEALLTDSISLKAEYRYNDYGSVDVSDFFSNENFESGISQEGDITVHSVRAVLSYRFGL